jgi:predicted permease
MFREVVLHVKDFKFILRRTDLLYYFIIVYVCVMSLNTDWDLEGLQ